MKEMEYNRAVMHPVKLLSMVYFQHALIHPFGLPYFQIGKLVL